MLGVAIALHLVAADHAVKSLAVTLPANGYGGTRVGQTATVEERSPLLVVSPPYRCGKWLFCLLLIEPCSVIERPLIG